MMGVAPRLLDQGEVENGDSIDGSTISSSASATLAPFHQTHKNSRPRGRRAVGGRHGDDEHNPPRSRAPFQNPLYKNVRGDDHHLSNDVSGARNGRGVRSSDRAPVRRNDVQGSIDGRTRLNVTAPMNVSGARNARDVRSSDRAPVRGNGVQGSIDGRVRLDDTTPMNVSGARNGRGVRSSDQAPVRGNGIQGSIDGRIRLGVTAPINRSDECGSADMSGMIVLQDPKRTRSSVWGSPSVRGGGGDRALPRVDHRRGDSIRSSGSGVLDVVDSGGRANSGGVYGGKEPSFRERGCLTTSTFLKLVTILAALCSVGLVWLQYDFATGRLCPHGKKNPCLKDPVSQALLSIAKLCAGALFPSIAICVLSKCYATRYYVNNSWLALVVDFEPTHKLHTYYGVVILLCSVIHSAAHLARLAYESNLELLRIDPMNRSGVAALVLLLPTALPMMVRYIKAKLTYELRKLMHMAFIPFIIAVCFHGAALRMLGSILLTWYLADRFYFTTKMTFFIGQPSFKIVGRGTFVRFYLPLGYHFKPGAYIQVNCPAISAVEWHPFSLFPVPGLRPRAGFHVEAIGDWTEELFRLCLENPQMPLWITAAQPSVLERTAYYDNVILVCTGAGITPAVCVIERLAKKKNVHLLWLSREAGMVAMFEKQVRRVRSTVHLTGKPSGKTKQRIIDLLAPARSEVVATTTAATATNSCSSSPVPSSSFDADALEACTRRAVASLRDFPGALRDGDEGADKKSENFWEESGSTKGASERSTGRHGRGSSLGEREGSQAPRGRRSNFGDGDGFEERRRGEHRRGRSQIKSKHRDDSGRGGRRSRSPNRDRARSGSPRRDRARSRSHSRSRSPRRDRARSRSRSRSRSPRRDRARSRSRSRSRSAEWLRIGKDSGGKRSRDLRPVSVCFGRPDIERYITETVEGTAVTAEWADVEADAETVDMSPPPSRLRQALLRLNTNQRISKKDLMSADLSVVKSKSTKPSSKARYSEVGVSSSLATSSSEGHCDDRSTWLVIYCGANLGVEKSVASTCGNLKVAWRKEYFSAW